MGKQELVEQRIEQDLRRGRWKPLEHLPAERQFAAEMGVDRGTLRAALRSLVGRGVLETLRGSGTIVKIIPDDPSEHGGTFRQRLQGFRLFMPSLVSACVGRISPLQILELERLLPMGGVALRIGDARSFVQMQLRFFAELVKVVDNPVVAKVAFSILPEARHLTRLLHHCSLLQREALFAALARLLSTLRHSNDTGARSATEDYAAELLRLLEEQA